MIFVGANSKDVKKRGDISPGEMRRENGSRMNSGKLLLEEKAFPGLKMIT